MPSPCNVTGELRSLEGVLLPAQSLSLQRIGVKGQDGAAVVPYDLVVTSDAGGLVDFDIYPGLYDGFATVSGRIDKFTLSVPEAASADISSIIDQAAPAITPSDVAAAAASATAAAASAASAATFDPALFLAKADNLSGLADTDTSITNLGGTTFGATLFKAASALAQRVALFPSFTGQAGKAVRVNSGETDVEYYVPSQYGDALVTTADGSFDDFVIGGANQLSHDFTEGPLNSGASTAYTGTLVVDGSGVNLSQTYIDGDGISTASVFVRYGQPIVVSGPTFWGPWTSVATTASLNASGDAPTYACRAWVNFDGTGTPTIRASGNVSSITDNGTGRYIVNFTTALEDANYSAQGSGEETLASNTTTQVSFRDFTTTSVEVCTRGADPGSFRDSAIVSVAIFR